MTPAELLTQGVAQATVTDIVVMPTPEQQNALIQAVQPAVDQAADTQIADRRRDVSSRRQKRRWPKSRMRLLPWMPMTPTIMTEMV